MQVSDEPRNEIPRKMIEIPAENLRGFTIGALVQYIGYPTRFLPAHDLTIGTHYIVSGIITMSRSSDVIFIQVEDDFHKKNYFDSKNFKVIGR